MVSQKLYWLDFWCLRDWYYLDFLLYKSSHKVVREEGCLMCLGHINFSGAESAESWIQWIQILVDGRLASSSTSLHCNKDEDEDVSVAQVISTIQPM